MSSPFEDDLANKRRALADQSAAPPHPAVEERRRHVAAVEADLVSIATDYAKPAAAALLEAEIKPLPVVTVNIAQESGLRGWVIHKTVVLTSSGGLLGGEARLVHRTVEPAPYVHSRYSQGHPRVAWQQLGKVGILPGGSAIDFRGRSLDLDVIESHSDMMFTSGKQNVGEPPPHAPQVCIWNHVLMHLGDDVTTSTLITLREVIVNFVARSTP